MVVASVVVLVVVLLRRVRLHHRLDHHAKVDTSRPMYGQDQRLAVLRGMLDTLRHQVLVVLLPLMLT